MEANPDRGVDPGTLSGDFVWQMEAIKQTLLLAEFITGAAEKQSTDVFKGFARSVGATEKVEPEGGVTFAVPPEHRRAADRVYRVVQTFNRGKGVLASTFLIAAVAEFDVFMAQILRWIWSVKPGFFGLDEKTITVSELRQTSDFSGVEEMLLDREIDELLRNSREDQYDFLEKRLKTPLGSSGERWLEFMEAHERRHLCVHTGGRVSRQYLSACKRLGIPSELEVGNPLPVTTPYVMRIASVFAEMAVMTAQVIWRKLLGSPNQDADSQLVDIPYRLIEDGKYRLASELLRFAVDNVKDPSSERVRKMWLINLAQAEKWQGNDEAALEVIKGEDWSAASLDFQLAVAVLQNRVNDATALMRQIGTTGSPSQGDYSDWPLFREFQSSVEFLHTYKEVFKQDFTPKEDSAFELKVSFDPPKRAN
tara:strand:+ start:11195 stop:12463 length:1269 start_codon:yes stop_codon:yes gene_type:complete